VVTAAPLAGEAIAGTFVAPTLIELASLEELQREVFGPVLHVVRYRRADLERLVDRINALGYGLTFGLHTRLDENMERVTARIRVGNVYVNRNIIGAVVGVQPFGGHGLSGTGPKAGGPLYLRRPLRACPAVAFPVDRARRPDPAAARFAAWLAARGCAAEARRAQAHTAASPLGYRAALTGPVGEENHYAVLPRGRILALAVTLPGLFDQLAAIFATGNAALVMAPAALATTLADLPPELAARLAFADGWDGVAGIAGALVEGDAAAIRAANLAAAGLPGPLVAVEASGAGEAWFLDALVTEVATSINTAAAGGNASLMMLGEG